MLTAHAKERKKSLYSKQAMQKHQIYDKHKSSCSRSGFSRFLTILCFERRAKKCTGSKSKKTLGQFKKHVRHFCLPINERFDIFFTLLAAV